MTQVFLDCRIIINAYSVPGENQILITDWLSVSLDIPACQEGLDQLSALRIFRYQSLSCLGIDYKGFIEASLDAIVDLSPNILAQGHALTLQLVQQGLCGFICQRPAGIIKSQLINFVAVLIDVFAQIIESQCLDLRCLEARLRWPPDNAYYAWIGGRPKEYGQISKIDYLLNALLF